MPFNGSGGTTQPVGGGFPAVPSTLIQSAKVNISIADIYAMLALCLVKDGQQTATQRVPFASGISTDTVTEKTADTGVTIDSVLLKDGRIDTTQGADITCAATIDLETATGNVVDVTGSTGPVTAVTLSQGHWRIVRFTGTPTLTNGASLVLPGAANIVVAAGDYALFVGYATGVVRCPLFTRAASISATLAGTETLTNKTISVASNTLNLTPITNSLGADVNLNNTGTYFDGPSVAQGASGTWFVSGTVTYKDPAAAAVLIKLWDGTTVISSAVSYVQVAGQAVAVALSGYISSPAGNLRISVRDSSSVNGKILFNESGLSKDSTISAIRIA